MKSLTEHLWFEVPNRRGFVNFTDVVERLVAGFLAKSEKCGMIAARSVRLRCRYLEEHGWHTVPTKVRPSEKMAMTGIVYRRKRRLIAH
jgi:hypothetical protein